MSEERKERIYARIRRFLDLLGKSDGVHIQETPTKLGIGIVFSASFRKDGIALGQILERWRNNAREAHRIEYEDNEEENQ